MFCDLRSWDNNIEQYVLEKNKKKKKTVLTDVQIARVKEIYQSWQEGIGYEDMVELCYSASIKEIRSADYSLAPSKYIKFRNHDLEINYDIEIEKILNKMKGALSQQKETVAILEEAVKEVE